MFNTLIKFEKRIGRLWEEGVLPYLLHFCGGNENELIEIFDEIGTDDYVVSSHRSHYHYLLKGGSRHDLEDIIKRGDSMFVFDRKLNFLSSSLLAGGASIAAGIAMALKLKGSKARVWCFVGDGAEDEGNFYEAVSFVEGFDLPCTFIIEDNDKSVETTKYQRRGKYVPQWGKCVRKYSYTPTYPHAGNGTNKKIRFLK